MYQVPTRQMFLRRYLAARRTDSAVATQAVVLIDP